MRFYCDKCKKFLGTSNKFAPHAAHMPKTGNSGWRSAYDGMAGVTVK